MENSEWLTMGLRKVGISEEQKSEIYCFECISNLRLDHSAILGAEKCFQKLVLILMLRDEEYMLHQA
ncbi:MAG: hypothetical protein AB1595_01145 [bacterium]